MNSDEDGKSTDPVDQFGEWLDEVYSKNYRVKLVKDLRYAMRDGATLIREASDGRYTDLKRSIDRYREFQTEMGIKPIMKQWPARDASLKGRARRKKKVNRGPKKIDRSVWLEVLRLAEQDHHQAAPAIHLCMLSGLRIGDVLRVEKDALAEAQQREDGYLVLELKNANRITATIHAAPRPWNRIWGDLKGSQHKNIASLCTLNFNPDATTHGAAYQSCRRRFMKYCKIANVPGKPNLHRLRHSVATFLHESGQSLADIQATLGHKNPKTTLGYLKDAQATMVADGLRSWSSQFD